MKKQSIHDTLTQLNIKKDNLQINFIFCLTFIFLITFSSSCENKKVKGEEDIKNKEEHVEKERDEQKKQIIDSLVSKYNIHYFLDTLKIRYSIFTKPIIESKYLLVNRFRVDDIFELDSTPHILISIVKPNLRIDIPIKRGEIELFSGEMRTTDDKILVITLKEIDKRVSDVYYAKGEIIEIIKVYKESNFQ